MLHELNLESASLLAGTVVDESQLQNHSFWLRTDIELLLIYLPDIGALVGQDGSCEEFLTVRHDDEVALGAQSLLCLALGGKCDTNSFEGRHYFSNFLITNIDYH